MKIPITSSIIRLDGPGFFVLGIGGGDGREGVRGAQEKLVIIVPPL